MEHIATVIKRVLGRIEADMQKRPSNLRRVLEQRRIKNKNGAPVGKDGSPEKEFEITKVPEQLEVPGVKRNLPKPRRDYD